jgi:hypothetical protein
MALIYTDQMFNYRGAANTTLTAMNAGITGTAGTYTPQLDGTLIKVDVLVVPQTAASLCQAQRVELSQTNWTPNVLRLTTPGWGVQTVGAGSINVGGNLNVYSFVVNQSCKTSWPITGNQVSPWFSPVTPAIIVTGYFTA